MTTTKDGWVPGGLYPTLTAISSTEVNSLPSGDTVLCSTQIDPSSGGTLSPYDQGYVLEVDSSSFTSGASGALGAYVAALNQDGSTYNDNRFATAAAGFPGGNLLQGQATIIPSVTQSQKVRITAPGGRPMPLYPAKHKIGLGNGGGSATLGSTVTVYMQTFIRQQQ